MNNYKKSLKYHEKYLKIEIKLVGEEHLNVAASYNSMGLVYKSMGNYTKALKYV